MKQLLRVALTTMVICVPITSFAAQASGPQHSPDQTTDATSKEAPRGDSATNAQTPANASGYGGSLNESTETSSFRPSSQTRALYSHH